MAELSNRNTAARSIRTVNNFTLEDNFNERLNIIIRGREQHLQTAWNRFLENHNLLLQRALENQQEEEAEEHNQLFTETEGIYLDALARLQARIRIAEQIEEDDSEIGDGENVNVVDNNDENVQNQMNEDNNEQNPNLEPNINQEQRHHGNQVDQQVLQPGAQLELLLQRLCHGFSSKKENTWGKFDGNLSRWQGFRDAFKAAVHDDEIIKPIFKFQLLKSSLEGRAAAALGEWQVTEQNYYEAWNWLNELYERKYQTSKQILFKLLHFQKLERASGFHIEKLVNVVQQVTRQLRAMNYPVQHYDLIFVHTIHEKLDQETSKEWELYRKSDAPTTKEMLEFLVQHGRALSSAQSYEKSLEKGKRHSNIKEHNYEQKKKKYQNSDNLPLRKVIRKEKSSIGLVNCAINRTRFTNVTNSKG